LAAAQQFMNKNPVDLDFVLSLPEMKHLPSSKVNSQSRTKFNNPTIILLTHITVIIHYSEDRIDNSLL
jgi:hypothetical protein